MESFLQRLKLKIENNRLAAIIIIMFTTAVAVLTLTDMIWKVSPLFKTDASQIERKKSVILNYSISTEAIGNHLMHYSQNYKSSIDSIIQTGIDSVSANSELINDLYSRIRLSGKLAETYANIESEFPGLTIEGKSIKQFRKINESLFQNFCDSVFASYQKGISVPYSNPNVRKALEIYIDRRILLKEQCQKIIE